MILATHAIAGAALGRLVPRYPWLAFLLGFASHFLLDAIPHWQYKVRSKLYAKNPVDEFITPGKKLAFDVAVVTLDFLVGVFLAFRFLGHGFSLTGPNQLSLLLGAVGGAFPDGLQFLYFVFRNKPLLLFEKFHARWHASRNFDPASIPGILLQAALVAAIILAARAAIFI